MVAIFFTGSLKYSKRLSAGLAIKFSMVAAGMQLFLATMALGYSLGIFSSSILVWDYCVPIRRIEHWNKVKDFEI